MESSGIKASLCLLLLMAPAVNLTAQAPAADLGGHAELPRFTLREIIAGRNDTLTRIPGAWLKAASAATPESAATKAYRSAASRSGLAALEGTALSSERSQHVMGLYHRAELSNAIGRVLTGIRAGLATDSTRARFDRLFRSGDGWIVDIHDAALAQARRRAPGTSWDAARRSLAAAHWLPVADSVVSEAVPRALYGLTVLAARDSLAFRSVRSELWRSDSVSAAAVMLLLNGYREGRQWYIDALDFFLTQPWIPGRTRHRSLANLVQEYWRHKQGAPAEAAGPLPDIQTRFFGHPQAVPHYGVPAAVFTRLVSAENQSARAWLRRHGQEALLSSLRHLPAGDTSLVLLQAGPEAIRVTTIPRQSRESLNGFLEPRDAIAIDPAYSPLLALGAVIHEWQHLVFRRRQLEIFALNLPSGPVPIVELPGIEPHLAEGFAEWSSELIMAPAVERWPLLAVGELQKRAQLWRNGAEDQHATGYALVKSLAAAIGNPDATTDVLLRHAENPAEIARHPAVRRAWKKNGDSGARIFPIPTHRILIPEMTFTIEDGFPDVISSRILVPPSRRDER